MSAIKRNSVDAIFVQINRKKINYGESFRWEFEAQRKQYMVYCRRCTNDPKSFFLVLAVGWIYPSETKFKTIKFALGKRNKLKNENNNDNYFLWVVKFVKAFILKYY